MSVDESKRRRRGTGRNSRRLDPADVRDHTVSVRLNAGELQQLDAQRGPLRMQRGEYLRTAALHKLPRTRTLPELNREAWIELARAAANLHQISRHMNMLDGELPVTIDELRGELSSFRASLIGAKRGESLPESPSDDDEDGEDEG